LDAWLDEVARTQTLIAPCRVGQILLYRRVTDAAQISREPGRPLLSLKEVVFPPTERLFTIRKNGGAVELEETLPQGQTVVFGVRPCDARGIRLLEAAFMKTDPVDAYFARRREELTLIGMACEELGPNCFCTSVGGAPDDPTGMDVMIHRAGDGFLAEAISDKGGALLAANGWPETVGAGDASRPAPGLQIPESAAWSGDSDEAWWLKMGERCLSCRACTYVCPTCRCFIVRDEAVQEAGRFERLRCWDACTGENYERTSGGDLLRPEPGQRLRNRVHCKVRYFPARYGLSGLTACTGCGRCIEICPVGIDITEILSDLGRHP
jgi:ferredoxin